MSHVECDSIASIKDMLNGYESFVDYLFQFKMAAPSVATRPDFINELLLTYLLIVEELLFQFFSVFPLFRRMLLEEFEHISTP